VALRDYEELKKLKKWRCAGEGQGKGTKRKKKKRKQFAGLGMPGQMSSESCIQSSEENGGKPATKRAARMANAGGGVFKEATKIPSTEQQKRVRERHISWPLTDAGRLLP